MNRPTLILGIDPGLGGALALFNPVEKSVIGVWDMPVHQIKKRNQIDLYQLSTLVDAYAKQIQSVVIEDVHSMPHDGHVGAFAFGKACGIVAGVAAAYFLPIIFVRPAVWKIQMGLTTDKDKSRQKVCHMFPKESKRFSRKKDDGRAEALLLAVFGERLIT